MFLLNFIFLTKNYILDILMIYSKVLLSAKFIIYMEIREFKKIFKSAGITITKHNIAIWNHKFKDICLVYLVP